MMTKREARWTGVLVLLVLLLPACRKAEEPAWGAGTGDMSPAAALDIDLEKVAAAAGARFRILKTEPIGRTPSHMFFWIAVGEDVTEAGLRTLAEAVVRATITARPRTYHSFTIHFFHDRDLKETLDKSIPFARATFLPDGDWQKVGRASIEDYSSYTITIGRRDGR